MTRIAIAHKDYDVRGGGEYVAEELAGLFDAPMFVGRHDPKNVPDTDEVSITEIDHRWWTKQMVNRGGVLRSLGYMLAWNYVPELTEYDTLILSGNEPLWYVPTEYQTVVAYTHSTPRFHYDLFQQGYNGADGYGANLFRQVYSMFTRTVYEPNTRRPDLFICNSDVVARRVQRYWNIPDEQLRVCYPPVDVTAYDHTARATGDYYLHVGRLSELKRIDEILEAFAGTDRQLKIVGEGPERTQLERQADDNVEFRGFVDEAEKRELMAGALATIFNAENEDFGIVPIESMAAGTPVIGVEEGFTQEQIFDGKNGCLYDRGVTNLQAAVERFEDTGVEWSVEEIVAYADQFSRERFEREMRQYVEEAQEHAEIGRPEIPR